MFFQLKLKFGKKKEFIEFDFNFEALFMTKRIAKHVLYA